MIAILSWNAHQTLLSTLDSYAEYGLTDTDDEKVIYFQEISEIDKQIARQYGYEAIGSDTNVGIADAYIRLVQRAKGEFFLFLENDWKLIQKPHAEIEFGKRLLRVGFDVIRYRHRMNPGHPLWTLQFKGNELSRPEHLLDSVHWLEHPDKISPLIGCALNMQKDHDVGDYHVARAMNANWTNNPTMFRTDWLREYIVPRIVGDVERNLQAWWQQQEFAVAQGAGLFTHYRID